MRPHVGDRRGETRVKRVVLTDIDHYLTEKRAVGLRGLSEFLAIPSVSALPVHQANIVRAAEYLATALAGIGFERVELRETGGAPAVYGEWLRAEGAPTALVYGHYDVQPVDPENLWTTPPFVPDVRQGRLYARGAADDKGQVWMHLQAADALLRTTGSLPVNLKLFIEGEEEIGSLHLGRYVQEHRDELASDVVVISDSSMYAPDQPMIITGLRGLVGMEFVVRGPRRDLHSGEYGGAVQNPLHALAELVSGLHDGEGRVRVAGFYDDVRPLASSERAALAQLPHDEDQYCTELGIPAVFGEHGYSTLERVAARPTVEVNGLWGGFQGEGAKTVIPADAHAKITCRLVPDQDPQKVLRALRRHLEEHCPPGVRLEVVASNHGFPASVISLDSPYVQAAARALRGAFGTDPVYSRMGGSIGVVPAFQQIRQAPVVLMGFGLADDCIHAPNESFDLRNYDRGIRAITAYWLELGALRDG